MTATDLKATLLAVLDEVADGEEVEVTKHGRPVARIVPIHNHESLRGLFAGRVVSCVDEEQLFSTGEIWDTASELENVQ